MKGDIDFCLVLSSLCLRAVCCCCLDALLSRDTSEL